LGLSSQGGIPFRGEFLNTCLGIFADGGVARFSFDEPGYEVVSEIGGEYGIIFCYRFSSVDLFDLIFSNHLAHLYYHY